MPSAEVEQVGTILCQSNISLTPFEAMLALRDSKVLEPNDVHIACGHARDMKAGLNYGAEVEKETNDSGLLKSVSC